MKSVKLDNERYIIPFEEPVRAVLVIGGGKQKVIRLFDRIDNRYFRTAWSCWDASNGHFGYVLWIYPKKPIRVYLLK